MTRVRTKPIAVRGWSVICVCVLHLLTVTLGAVPAEAKPKAIFAYVANRSSGTVSVIGIDKKEEKVYGRAQEGQDTARTWMHASDLHIPRAHHTATLLLDGRVLVAGGADASGTATASAELFDPVTETWRLTGDLKPPREGHRGSRSRRTKSNDPYFHGQG
jgi:hypothetical protein